MNGVGVLKGALTLNLLAQLAAGGLGFALVPEAVLGVSVDAAARLGFRLAGFTNATTAAFTLYAVLRLDPPALRALAGCLAGYHVLAGAEALRGVSEGGALAAVGASAGPFHIVSALLLVAAVGWSARRG